ncbi:MAG TPA: hypothetical protein VN641_02580 [Urbifossiella sp.]|nr:hypothetical protein [Urbifossiella sp.]
MVRFAWIPLFVLASCSQPSPPAPPEVRVAAAKPTPTEPDAKPPAPEEKLPPEPPPAEKEEPPPVFPFPDDAAGKALPAVVAPRQPAPPPVEKFGQAPTTRRVPGKVIEPSSLPRARYAPPPLLLSGPASAAIAAPRERIPLDLGFGASAVPARPLLPESPGITLKARDVKRPPVLPSLGRQLSDRASLDDPTAEPGNAAIVSRSPTFILGVASFLKVALPDPFELAEQVKGLIPAKAEPSAAPVPVNPQRIK